VNRRWWGKDGRIGEAAQSTSVMRFDLGGAQGYFPTAMASDAQVGRGS
jgi:hypothetical protein